MLEVKNLAKIIFTYNRVVMKKLLKIVKCLTNITKKIYFLLKFVIYFTTCTFRTFLCALFAHIFHVCEIFKND